MVTEIFSNGFVWAGHMHGQMDAVRCQIGDVMLHIHTYMQSWCNTRRVCILKCTVLAIYTMQTCTYCFCSMWDRKQI